MSAVGHSRARNVRFSVLIVSDAATLILSDAQHATGARYRALPLERWPDFEGAGIYYAATELEARGCTGSPVTVVGGANSAGQAALYLAGRGSEVSLVVRGPDIATEMSAYLVDRLLAHPRVTVRRRSEVTRLDGGDFLEEVTITDRTADTAQAQPCAGLFCFIGAEPATSWLTGIATGDDGFLRTDVQLTGDDLGPDWATLGRRPLPFETSIPGVFAVGDVHFGSMKRSPQLPAKAPAPSPRYTRPSPRWPSDHGMRTGPHRFRVLRPGRAKRRLPPQRNLSRAGPGQYAPLQGPER